MGELGVRTPGPNESGRGDPAYADSMARWEARQWSIHMRRRIK
jgi:hypothetical protein